MIRKIKAKSFKSLKNIEVGFEKFNVLIGPNASGKSNFIDIFSFLSEMTLRRDLREILELRGGFERVVFSKEAKFEIEIEISVNDELYKYFLRVMRQEPYCEEKAFCDEKLLFDRRGNKLKIYGEKEEEVSLSSAYESIYAPNWTKEKPYLRDFFKIFSSWKSYQLITSEMRKNLPAKKTFKLERSGSNLAQVLLSLHTERPKIFGKIEEILKQGISEVEELLTPLTEDGRTFIAIRERGFEQEFNYYQLSDGTLKLLSYITAAYLPEPQLLCFEEPENFIHPHLLQLLVEILKKSEKQIILSTHSPYLVDFVEPEEVLIVEKEEGQTIIKRIEDIEKIKETLKEILLGELWYSGEFGGIP